MNQPLFTDKVAEIFVKVDDFCNHFENEFKNHALPASGTAKKRNRKTTLTDSQIITILITFDGGQFRNFKHFYMGYLCVYLKDCFAAYSFFPKKPSIKIDIEETNPKIIAQLNQPKLIAA